MKRAKRKEIMTIERFLAAFWRRKATVGAPAAVALAARFCVPALWRRQPRLHAGRGGRRGSAERLTGLDDGGDDLPRGAGAARRLVLGDLSHESRQEGDLGAAVEQGDRGKLSDGLTDGAQDL